MIGLIYLGQRRGVYIGALHLPMIRALKLLVSISPFGLFLLLGSGTICFIVLCLLLIVGRCRLVISWCLHLIVIIVVAIVVIVLLSIARVVVLLVMRVVSTSVEVSMTLILMHIVALMLLPLLVLWWSIMEVCDLLHYLLVEILQHTVVVVMWPTRTSIKELGAVVLVLGELGHLTTHHLLLS